ncbi:recombinase family protein [Candidatus Pantoea multigeneris]|uniref:recombinase family protein n=1 Tax=Candidatus Pantoea multigeneris TaxID=2608357 RepID=UPI0034E2B803
MTSLHPGDAVVIWRRDRLGRSLKNLLQMVEWLDGLRVGLRSLQESIDTTSSGGRLVFHLFGSLPCLNVTWGASFKPVVDL